MNEKEMERHIIESTERMRALSGELSYRGNG